MRNSIQLVYISSIFSCNLLDFESIFEVSLLIQHWLSSPFYLVLLWAKRKQTKRVLRKIYYSPQSKDSISLEVAVETKLFPDSALGNSLCNSGYKTKSENPLFFSRPPMPLEIELLPTGWSHGVPSMPRNLEEVRLFWFPWREATNISFFLVRTNNT